MAWPWASLTARFDQHVRVFAEKGLSEELLGAPDSRLIYAQAGKPLIDNGARPAADDDDDEGEEIAADLGELDIPGVGDY